MALIVETGVGVPKADAYVDTAYADQYHSDRANGAWADADQPTKEAAIRKATQFLDMRYLRRWKGSKLSILQARQFPRYGVSLAGVRSAGSERFDGVGIIGYVPSNLVPEPIMHATCELALRALDGDLAPDLPRGGQIQSQKVDVIETTYFQGAPGHTVYDLVELLIGEYLVEPGANRIVRA